jgi:hypothetical protein
MAFLWTVEKARFRKKKWSLGKKISQPVHPAFYLMRKPDV